MANAANAAIVVLLWLAALSFPAVLVQSQRICQVHEKCVPLPECKSLLRLVTHKQRKPTDEEKGVLRASQCGWSPTSTYMPLVCCDLVPWDGHCGLDTGVEGELTNGPALAAEFPWMARLVYRGLDGTEQLNYGGCAAALISSRYLLTAARCVVGRAPPAYVRLGELDAEGDPDCSASGTECAPAAFNVAVEDVIAHPEYVADTAGRELREHDIALVRTKTRVEFNKHVAPVCLPIADPHGHTLDKSRPLIVLGWGNLSTANATKTRYLTKSVLKEVPNEFCTEKYKATPDHVDGVHQMCGRGYAEATDACLGDPGAPLTSRSLLKGEVITILEGVASFGTASCATDGMPAVFSRVSTYLPWIMTNIKLE